MKLISARIQNYKCINDSEEFSIGDLTCLAGKNESGKTALLQALRKLNPVEGDEEHQFNHLHEYPRTRYSPRETPRDPVLTTEWKLSPSDVEDVQERLGPGAIKEPIVRIERGYDNRTKWFIEIADTDMTKHMRSNTDGDQEAPETIAEEILHSKLPHFLYFPQYGTLPGKISVNEMRQHFSNHGEYEDKYRYFQALLELAGTDVEDLGETTTSEELIAKLEVISNRTSQQIFKYWSQNRDLNVEIRYDQGRAQDPPPFNEGDVIQLRVRNQRHQVTTEFDARSTGFVWFFSFLVWFSHMEEEHEDNLIILLDEPGLSLHGTAQSDLLKYIKTELVPKYQVIYTTHSPFMIDATDLMTVRTVEDKTSEDTLPLGTKVGDKVLSTDAETLFPLRAAIGYSITQSLFIGENCLLVEGPSDLLYLYWASNLLEREGLTKLDRRWTITPTGGITKAGTFASLFAGHHINLAVLADYHHGEKRLARDLRESTILKANQTFLANEFTDKEESDTEDLIGWPMYRKLVNRTYNLNGDQKLPTKQPKGPPVRVLEVVEEHFRTKATGGPMLDHYQPALYLQEHQSEFQKGSDLKIPLQAFDSLFRKLNEILQ